MKQKKFDPYRSKFPKLGEKDFLKIEQLKNADWDEIIVDDFLSHRDWQKVAHIVALEKVYGALNRFNRSSTILGIVLFIVAILQLFIAINDSYPDFFKCFIKCLKQLIG